MNPVAWIKFMNEILERVLIEVDKNISRRVAPLGSRTVYDARGNFIVGVEDCDSLIRNGLCRYP